MNKWKRLLFVLIGTLVLSAAQAQGISEYPTKTVSLIVGFPTGTAEHRVFRLLVLQTFSKLSLLRTTK